MKRYNQIVLGGLFSLILAFSPLVLSAQLECACAEREYPYRFCENGKLVIYCTSDPNNFSVGGNILPPAKRSLPTCYTFDSGTLPGAVSMTRKSGPGSVTVFNPTDVSSDLADAFGQWKSLWEVGCGITGDPNPNCCLPISFSRNPADFDDPRNTLASTETFYSPFSCAMLCLGSMVINHTNEFLTDGRGQTAPISTAMYTGPTQPMNVSGTVYSFRDVMAHEMGHWLGLVHSDETGGCRQSPGVMNQYAVPNTYVRGLLDHDRCQFLKLYCPDEQCEIRPLEVDIVGKLATLSVYPNPFSKKTTLEVSVPETSLVEVRVYDNSGQEVMTLVNEQLFKGAYAVDLDGTLLPAGSYWCVYRINGVVIEKEQLVLAK